MPSVLRIVSRWLAPNWTLHQVRCLGGDSPLSAVADTPSDEMAAILFTSGSTSIAKGVVYTHGIFAAQVKALRRLYGIEINPSV
jgi:olefin beta-lactone synthetase